MASKFFILVVWFSQTLVTFAVQPPLTMTDEMIYRIFHSNRDEVPDYQIVSFISINSSRPRRELRRVEYDVSGSKVLLNLYPVENDLISYARVWVTETDRQTFAGHRYDKIFDDIQKIFYEDRDKMAVLLGYYNDGYIYYDGIIGENKAAKIVRSFPESWGWIETDLKQKSPNHIIFDMSLPKNPTQAVGNLLIADNLSQPLDVLYPKLLIVLTNDYFRKFQQNINETLDYVTTFWNAVQLKYNQLTDPKVNIIISGIIIAKDETALRYVYDSRIPYDMNKLNTRIFLNNQNDYFERVFNNKLNLHNYNAIITITSLDAGATAGQAYIGTICQNTYNVGFVYDDGRFAGLQSATHELGHLLNITHDGSGAASSCTSNPEPDVGTIMSPIVQNVKKLVWSDCSKRILRDFAATKAAECLKSP